MASYGEKDSNHLKVPLNSPKQPEMETRVELKRRLGLLNGITVIVGCIIGSGIFASPKGVLQHSGSIGLSLLVWFGCGIFSMIGAYCFTELGTMIPKSGGDYAYILEAFGDIIGFLRLWVESIIVRPCTVAIVALTFSYYVIEPIYPSCEQPNLAVVLLAALCIGEFPRLFDLHWPFSHTCRDSNFIVTLKIHFKKRVVLQTIPHLYHSCWNPGLLGCYIEW